MKRILVADDDPATQFLINTVLKSKFEVVMAVDGVQAEEQLRARADWDCVVLDIAMPNKDGMEVLNFIKGNPHLQHIPVIMLTGLNDIRTQASAMQGGAVTYFRKPFSPTQLVTMIVAAMKA